MPLTVLAITDEVSRSLYDSFQKERWKDVDLIVSCGDLPPEYLDFLVTSLDVPVFYVRGNHDGAYRASQYAGCHDIHGKIVKYRGVRVAGFEGSLRYNDGAVQYSQGQMRRMIQRRRLQALRVGPPDLIVTHAPPVGPHSGNDQCHGGFESFNTAIQLWHPAVVVHGHMHAYNGAQAPYTVGSTTVMNAFPFVKFEIPVPVPAQVSEAQTVRAHGLKRFLAQHRAH